MFAEAQADFAHKEARLQELRCQAEEQCQAHVHLTRKFALLEDERKCAGEPAHYEYLLKEAEFDIQRHRQEVEDLTC